MAESPLPSVGESTNPLLNPQLLANPYPVYAMLRKTNPVMRLPLPIGQDGPGVWLLTRHADVQAVLRDPRFSVNRRKADLVREYAHLLPKAIIGDDDDAFRTMLIMDPPDHTRVRGLVSKAFTPRRIAALRPRVEAVLAELLDEVVAGASGGEVEFDLIPDVAEPLPAIVIAELLGVPAEDHRHFKGLSKRLISSMGQLNPAEAAGEIQSAIEDLQAYLASIVALRRKEPRDDMISALIAARDDEDALSEAELVSTANLLLIAGHETTTNLIGNGMLALLRHPDQLERLRTDPALAGSAVDECLRYDSPVQVTVRVPTEDVEIGGQVLPKGAAVVTAIGAANRDPEAFPDPESFDVGRAENHHLSLGFGTHFCLGAALARTEGEVVLLGLLRRFSEIELVDPDPPARPNFLLRGFSALPLRCRVSGATRSAS
jgi:cytochrome P450